METVDIWTRFEASFESARAYENPSQDVELVAEFQSPEGRVLKVLGFWDGGQTWKVRFSPERSGEWSYRTDCSPAEDAGLHNQRVTPHRVDEFVELIL